MTTFDGFPERIFECCKPSEEIRKPINSLKELRFEIEPELKKINPALIGHVSRTKKKGTNDYHTWAWLYFNTIGVEAYRYSQLTVNISPSRLYAGVYIRTHAGEHEAFFNEIEKEENWELFERITRTLSGREWIISTDVDEWERQEPRRYSVEELRGRLLDPYLRWINACFDKNEPIVKTSKIADEVVQIFKELYNIYAMASGNQMILPPSARAQHGIYKHVIVEDIAESFPESDESAKLRISQFLLSLITSGERYTYHMPGRKDQYSVRRTALEFNLKPYQLQFQGETVTIYSDKDINPFLTQIFRDYPLLSERLNRISELESPKGFPQNDAGQPKI